ncbi:tudor domain-containing protein 1 isoform X2 [Daphnia magna]|nr:tudor domain-containing protein 1 isoform X2 [Daphnia magna]
MVASILVHVTHVDDSIHDHQDPFIQFWGMTHDQSLYFLMKSYIASVQDKLKSRAPPLSIKELDNKQIYCVLINRQWHRAKVPKLKLSLSGTLEVFCIDFGDTHSVPLAFVRTVDFPGSEAEHIRNWPPLASKFNLADILAPYGNKSNAQLSLPAMFFVKTHMVNRTWKAVTVGAYDGHQCLRLFDFTNQLFVTTMIECGMAIASKTYNKALKMCKIINEHPANFNPFLGIFPESCDMPNPAKTSLPAFTRNSFEISMQEASPSVVPFKNELIEAANAGQNESKSPLTYAPQLKKFVAQQIISTVAIAPFVKSLTEFWVQLEPDLVSTVAERISKLTGDPDFVSRNDFVASAGKPCLALFASDGCWYRALIEAVNDEFITIYYVDYGNRCVVENSCLQELPPDLIVLPALAFKCCLNGAENFYKDFSEAFQIDLTKLSAFSVKYFNTVNDVLHVRLYASDGVELVQRRLFKFPLMHAVQTLNFSPEQMVSPRAVASYIKSLFEFWVQLEPKTVGAIMGRLDMLALHPEFINQKTFIASVGKPCLAFYQDEDTFFPDDGRWHRAVVEEVNGDTARVYHFDYGYSCTVKMSHLRNLPSEYTKQPAQAFRCCLVGAESMSEEDSDAFMNRFVKRSIFAVKFLKEVDGILHIRLFTLGGVDLFERHYEKPVLPETTELPVEKVFDDEVTGPFAFLVLTPSRHSENGSRLREM